MAVPAVVLVTIGAPPIGIRTFAIAGFGLRADCLIAVFALPAAQARAYLFVVFTGLEPQLTGLRSDAQLGADLNMYI